MSVTHVVGVDPGLVHTGVVRLAFLPEHQRIHVQHEVVLGTDVDRVKSWTESGRYGRPLVYIEKYQPRSHFGGDIELVQFVGRLRHAMSNSAVVSNTGVKQVVKKPLMELLHVWSFATRTHHQDLRSAARIALYGMLKSEPMNRLLADVVRDHIQGATWDVCD